MRSESVLEEVWQLHDAGRSHEVIERAEAAWPSIRGDAWAGEVARFAMLAAFRLERTEDARRWRDTALDEFRRAAYLPGLALLLVNPSYEALNAEKPDIALTVISVAAALVDIASETPGPVPPEVLQRLRWEKTAYVLAATGRPAAAVPLYERALEHAIAGEDERGVLKVRGGLVIARYSAFPEGGTDDVARWLRELAEEARDRAPDIAETCEENLRRLRAGARSFGAFLPFEVR